MSTTPSSPAPLEGWNEEVSQLDENMPPGALALVGPGRAGTTIALALRRRGWSVTGVAGRSPGSDAATRAAALLDSRSVAADEIGAGAQLVIVATPDSAIAARALALAPSLEPSALVIHLSGARGLADLAGLAAVRRDVRLGVLHPLQSLPSAEVGVGRLAGSWCAVSGPREVAMLAESLAMRPIAIADDARATYHAAATVASNHLVALLGQVERLAQRCGVPFEAFLPLVRATVDNVAALGASAALTGPVARGDVATVAQHLDSIPADERASYRALADEARRLIGHDDPALRALLAGAVA